MHILLVVISKQKTYRSICFKLKKISRQLAHKLSMKLTIAIYMAENLKI